MQGQIKTFSTFSVENVRFSPFDYSNYIIMIIINYNLKVMNELRFKIQGKHIFIYYVFKVLFLHHRPI